MFDRAIIDTDRFMDLSMSAKALYFLLGMEADDEGFVSYKKVMRVHGGNEDDIKILRAKNFIIQFKSGVVVITDWNKNNWLDTRRVKNTEYQTERKMLLLNNDKTYGLADAKHLLNQSSIEENRVEENRVDNTSPKPEALDQKRTRVLRFTEKDMSLVEIFKSLIISNYPGWVMKGSQDVWAEDINKIYRIDGRTYEQIEFMIRWTQKDPFWSKNILSASKLREKFNDLIPRLKEIKNNSQQKYSVGKIQGTL